MHERTQKLLCRVGFLLLCVLPTSGSLAWIAYARTEHYDVASVAAWESRLSEWTGMQVTIGQVRHPRPNTTLLKEVVWTEPESGQRVASVRLVEITRDSEMVSIVASQPTVNSAQLPGLISSLHDRLLKRLSRDVAPVGILSTELTMESGGGGTTLADVQAVIESSGNDSRVSIGFRTAGAEASDRVLFRVTRHRTDSPATTWELHTGSQPFPCSAAAAHFPWLAELGSHCQFRGSAQATQTPRGWQGMVSGQFSHVDLDRLISQRFPHKLSGLADVALKEARFDEGRLSSLDARLASRGGVISQSLLAAANREMSLRQVESFLETESRLVAYDQLAFQLSINSQGVLLHGECEGQLPRTLLAGHDGPILLDSDARRSTTASLVRMLASSSDHQVPATRETAELFRILPLPPIARADDSQAGAYVPLRMSP